MRHILPCAFVLHVGDSLRSHTMEALLAEVNLCHQLMLKRII